MYIFFFFFFQAEDGIRDGTVTGVQTCALPISLRGALRLDGRASGSHAGRRGSSSGGARLHRETEPAAWTCRGWQRPIFPLPPPPALERARAGLDGVGTQAREASRAEPAASKRHRYLLSAGSCS